MEVILFWELAWLWESPIQCQSQAKKGAAQTNIQVGHFPFVPF